MPSGIRVSARIDLFMTVGKIRVKNIGLNKATSVNINEIGYCNCSIFLGLRVQSLQTCTMKRYGSLFVLAMLSCMLLFPSKSQAQFSLGIEAGGSLANWHYSNDDFESKALLFAFGGIQGNYGLSEKVSILLSVQFGSRGARVDTELPNIGDVYYRGDRISIMPAFGYQIGKFKFNIGPYMSFVTEQYVKSGSGDWKSISYDLLNESTSGLHAGALFDIGRFYVKTQYLFGLSPNSELEATNPSGEPIGKVKAFDRTIQLGVGYNIIQN